MAEKLYEGTPERVVIMTGPTFSTAVKFILFGAALGFAGANYLQKKTGRPAGSQLRRKASQKADEVLDSAAHTVEDGLESAGESIEERLKSLAGRIRDVSYKAKDIVEAAGETVRPTFERAVIEGKKAALDVQTRLKADIDEAGDRPALASEDEELPSQKENKYVE